jgi:AhpC/TSA family.
LGALYVKQKRSALKSIMEHPYSLTNITLLYQKFNENFPIFADINDGLIFKRVYDSLKVSYPSSMYLKSLEVDIQNFDKSRMLQDKFSQVSEISYPNVLGYDINSKKRELYELSGKPFILVFWTSTQVAQKMFNLDLLDIYNKYHSAGLEIYQISVDTDKVQWATTIKDQKLPWINVCDGSGNASPAIASYNISKLPSLFLFDREGNMKGKDIFDKSKLENVVSSIIK